MEIQSNDPFFKMFSTPQTCDLCMKQNKEISRITLHPIYSIDEVSLKISPIGYQPAKKCKNCCEEEK